MDFFSLFFSYFVANKYTISYQYCVSLRESQKPATTFALLLAEMRLFGRNLLAWYREACIFLRW